MRIDPVSPESRQIAFMQTLPEFERWISIDRYDANIGNITARRVPVRRLRRSVSAAGRCRVAGLVEQHDHQAEPDIEQRQRVEGIAEAHHYGLTVHDLRELLQRHAR